jgi:Recombination endonuclease VII
MRDKVKQSAYMKEHRKKFPEKFHARDRLYHLKNNFGMTEEEYGKLLNQQAGVCAICRRKCVSGRRLAIDHDHTTKKVRGLLCMKCNRSLGGFDDDPQLLVRAIDYLLEFQKIET